MEITAEFEDSSGDSECCFKFIEPSSPPTVHLQGISEPQGYNVDHNVTVKIQGVFNIGTNKTWTCRFFKNFGTSPELLSVSYYIGRYNVGV